MKRVDGRNQSLGIEELTGETAYTLLPYTIADNAAKPPNNEKNMSQTPASYAVPKLNLLNLAEEWLRATLRDPAQHFRVRMRRSCPCCGYKGYFASTTWGVHKDFRCPNCSSRPRDRQIALYFHANAIDLRGKRILHFAPEWPLFRQLKNEPGYVGGDIIKRRNANAIVDITDIRFPDEHFDLLICNHVLEHVPDDRKALKETFRVLKQGGLGIFSVPMSKAQESWEPPAGMPQSEVERICGWDHKRFYGQDFDQRLMAAGFTANPIPVSQAEKRAHALLSEKIFVATKRA